MSKDAMVLLCFLSLSLSLSLSFSLSLALGGATQQEGLRSRMRGVMSSTPNPLTIIKTALQSIGQVD